MRAYMKLSLEHVSATDSIGLSDPAPTNLH